MAACLSDWSFLTWSLPTGTLPGGKGRLQGWMSYACLWIMLQSSYTPWQQGISVRSKYGLKLGSTINELLGTLLGALTLKNYHYHHHHPHLLIMCVWHFIRIFFLSSHIPVRYVGSMLHVTRDKRFREIKQLSKLFYGLPWWLRW